MSVSVRFHSPYLPQFSSDPVPPLLEALAGAHKSLDLCLDQLGVESVVAQAAALRDRGVRVRWIMNPPPANGHGATDLLLAKYGFRRHQDWRSLPTPSGKICQKFILVDGRRVLLGSMSLTSGGVYLRDSVEVTIDSSAIGEAFGRAMDTYWRETTAPQLPASGRTHWPELIQAVDSVEVGPDQRASAVFTPYDGNLPRERLLELIADAEQQIHFVLPDLSDPRVADALEERAKAAVHITGVVDANCSRPEQFSHTPTLRALVFAGKIRAMRPIDTKAAAGGEDVLATSLVSIDGRWVFVAGSGFDSLASARDAQSALVIDSGPVARQCAHFADCLGFLAKTGGHTRDRCRSLMTYRLELSAAAANWGYPDPEEGVAKVIPIGTGRKAVARRNAAARAPRRHTASASVSAFARRKARASAKKRVSRLRVAAKAA